jgi:hypothetical protein
VVPGSGEANFDTFENNPYQNVQQRQEQEVRQLLEKLPPDMITLDASFVGKLNSSTPAPNKTQVSTTTVAKKSNNSSRKQKRKTDRYFESSSGESVDLPALDRFKKKKPASDE